MKVEIESRIQEYIELNNQMDAIKKETKKLKEALLKYETEIQEFMESQPLDSLTINGVQISLMFQKVSMKFKKETIVKKLQEKLDSKSAEELTEEIMTNKETTDGKLRLKIKKTF